MMLDIDQKRLSLAAMPSYPTGARNSPASTSIFEVLPPIQASRMFCHNAGSLPATPNPPGSTGSPR
jgi:hypothetical protein